MSIDILYWSDNNFSFQTLNELMHRLQTTLKEKIYLMYYDSFEKKTYWSFDSNTFTQISNIDSCKNLYKYKLEIIDCKNLIQNFSQNIYELLHNNKIEIILSFANNNSLDVTIKEKTILWDCWDISFSSKMGEFITSITDSDIGFTKQNYKILYLMNQILKSFNSTELLLIGDNGGYIWGGMENQLFDGKKSIKEIIKDTKSCNLITSEMILSKKVKQITEYQEMQKTVFLFNFKELCPYFIQCNFEDFLSLTDNEEYEIKINESKKDKIVETLKVTKTFDMLKKDNVKSSSVIIDKYQDDRYKCKIFAYDLDNNVIFANEVLFYQYEKMKSIIKQALSLDLTSLISKFNYSKGSGDVYSISYKKLDFSFSISLWINNKHEGDLKNLVDFVESVFKSATEEPENCINIGNIKILGVPKNKRL